MKNCLPLETRAYYIKGLLYDASYIYIYCYFAKCFSVLFGNLKYEKKIGDVVKILREESPKNFSKHS